MRLSAIDVQVVRNFAAKMVELVEAGELAPKTVNNTLSCLSTCLKDAVALHKVPSNPCEHIAHLPGSHIERDWLRRSESRCTWRRARSRRHRYQRVSDWRDPVRIAVNVTTVYREFDPSLPEQSVPELFLRMARWSARH